jgi:hypothetical protein
LAQRNLEQSEDELGIHDPHGPDTSRKADRDFRRAVHKHHSDVYNIHIVLVELRGEESANVLFGSMGSGVLPIYAGNAQRVPPFRFPFLLQSPTSRTWLEPQATPYSPLKTKLFLASLRVLKRNIPAFSLQIREFSPKLEGRPISPIRFNALI